MPDETKFDLSHQDYIRMNFEMLRQAFDEPGSENWTHLDGFEPRLPEDLWKWAVEKRERRRRGDWT